MSRVLTETEVRFIDDLVDFYRSDMDLVRATADQLRRILELPPLRQQYHSIRWRVKDPEHLRDKLTRKLLRAEAAGTPFDITRENLSERVTDLAGVRLLHLHTSEFERINSTLCDLLEEHRYVRLEGPEARVWDDELSAYYDQIGVPTVRSERMYTSVHYVVETNTRTKRTAEIQVRTLAEELWGEVDHTVNYPEPSEVLACREQIKVLARLTSTCTRLVDSIFITLKETADRPTGPEGQ
jgi:putative GTP pyrophosphokinase